MSGKVIFGVIPKLPHNWWTSLPLDDPADVWTKWDRDTYYLWGANQSNYKFKKMGDLIGGGGMAGPTIGPTRGMQHPHYVGVNTMEYIFIKDNDQVFADLKTMLDGGKNIVFPIYPKDSNKPEVKECSLGTGLGTDVDDWDKIQKSIFEHILKLVPKQSTLEEEQKLLVIPDGTCWPKCSEQIPWPLYKITERKDIEHIVNVVLGSS